MCPPTSRHFTRYCFRSHYIYRFRLSCCIMFPSRGMQQSACVDGGPPDRSVLGVYVQQVAILPIFSHTFIPGLSCLAFELVWLFLEYYSSFPPCPETMEDLTRDTQLIDVRLSICWQEKVKYKLRADFVFFFYRTKLIGLVVMLKGDPTLDACYPFLAE